MAETYIIKDEEANSYAATIAKNYIGWLSDKTQALEFDTLEFAREMKALCEAKNPESNLSIYKVSFEVEKAD